MKLRNSANSAWITLFQLDGEWTNIAFENGTAAAPSIYFKDSGTDTGIYSPGTDQVGISAGGTSRFEVSTTATTSTLPVVHPLGAVGTPSITFTGDLNTGIYSPAADTIAFVEGGVEAMRIDSSSRVGIGTASPADGLGYGTALDIRGSGTGNGGVVYLRNSDASVTGFVAAFGDGRMDLGTSTNHPLKFITNSNERGRFDSSGRFLVGTSTSPSSGFGQYARLVVQGQPADATGGGNFSIQRGEAAAGGNITSGEGIGNISWNDNAGNTFGLIGCEADANAGTNDYPGRLVFSTTADGASSPTERMRITNNGSVCINNTTRQTQGTLCPDGIVGTQPAISCYQNATTSQEQITFRNPNGGVGTITTNGSATAYNTSSDYRLKENVVPLTGAANRINQLQVHRFNFISDPDRTVDGFIAHEAQAVVPECVTGTKDEVDADGNPIYQGIDQSKLVPLLTAALQETIAELQALKAEIASLKGA
jgi:hypothetical protein